MLCSPPAHGGAEERTGVLGEIVRTFGSLLRWTYGLENGELIAAPLMGGGGDGA